MVAIPFAAHERCGSRGLVDQLECTYLANPDAELRFALLSDWTTPTPRPLPGDETCSRAPPRGSPVLNIATGASAQREERFYLFHRARRWNAARTLDGMGAQAREAPPSSTAAAGATDTSFVAPGGAAPVAPSGVRYVITLDADTRLPVEARGADRHDRAPAEPRALRSTDRPRAFEGYGVLQPARHADASPDGALGLSMGFQPGRAASIPTRPPRPTSTRSLRRRLVHRQGHLRRDAFEASLDGRVPENRSQHDLFEASSRAPGSSPTSHSSRSSRPTTRGGVFARIAGPVVTAAATVDRSGAEKKRTVSRRWKMGGAQTTSDGRWWRRRRSSPWSAAWSLPARAAGTWSKFILALLALPVLLPVLASLVPRRPGISKRRAT